jgi:hypothetical protein
MPIINLLKSQNSLEGEVTEDKGGMNMIRVCYMHALKGHKEVHCFLQLIYADNDKKKKNVLNIILFICLIYATTA